MSSLRAPAPSHGAFWIAAESGSVVVEFVAIFPLFMALMFAIFQAALIYVAEAYLETATEAGARLVLTHQTQGLTSAQFRAMICGEITALFDCSKLIVSLQPAPRGLAQLPSVLPKFDKYGRLQGSPPYFVPVGEQKVVLTVSYPWPVIGGPFAFYIANLGNGAFLMSSIQVFQTEAST